MVVGAQVYAASIDDVIGTYSMKYSNRFWIKGEGTLRDTTFGTIKIKANKEFVAIENDGGDTKTYSGEFSVKGKKFLIEKTNSLRSQIEIKALKPWLEEYVRDEGANINNIKFTYSKYKITKAKIKSDGPNKLKIILQGTVRGKVSGEGNVKRKFKYRTTVTFQDRN